MVLTLILKALYFFLPAYFANMAPVLLKWMPLPDTPIQERWFGKNKTWRGLFLAIVLGTLIFYLQKLAYQAGFTSLALIDYDGFSFLFGILLGAGAIAGDLIKSYFKRKRKIKPGQPWFPWDQLDFVFGGLIAGMLVYVPPAEIVLVLLVLSPVLHMLFSYIGYRLRMKQDKF